MVSADQTNFPVLVSLSSDGDLAADAQDDGDDLVFTDSAGTRIPHEIESFSDSTGALDAWVNVPAISASTNTDIYLYYGNSGTASQQNPTGVWDSNYVGVWHLKESGTGADYEYIDSTYNNPGQGGEGLAAYVPTRVAGKIGYGQDFSNGDGKWDLIDLHNSSSLDVIGNQITVEAWIQPGFDQADPGNITRGFINHKGWFNGYSFVMNNWGCSQPNCVFFGLPGQNYSVTSDNVVSKNTWHHVVGTYNG
ncbi:MAG: DUF2341 domain-containing protein, partial [Methanomicrobiales archaeon]|nr:DUF2341 domain-containing protein [Methanomicrobiales archaeon]